MILIKSSINSSTAQATPDSVIGGMYKYGKTAQSAVAVISYLAERFDAGATRHSSLTIADDRQIPKPLVAKMLSILSTADLIKGAPGPRGGYWLERDPASIRLVDVVRCFEKEERRTVCPYGSTWCGNGPECPLHAKLTSMDEELFNFLNETTLSVFAKAKQL